MRKLGQVGRFKFYWAQRHGFLYPGLHVWTGKRHWRVLPILATRWARSCRSPEDLR